MVTHFPSVKCVGTISYVYSTSPWAGIATGFCIWTTRSGAGMFHPLIHCRGGGASWALPTGAFDFAHVSIVLISPAESDGSFEKWPTPGSANHGGILRWRTESAIARASGRTSW